MESIGNGNVQLAIDDHRADVVLDRPEKRNAMNMPLLSDLLEALETVENHDDVRAMALLGNGPIFCAGMDLEMMKGRAGSDVSIETGLGEVTDFIREMSVPSVAGIKGAAIAGSFELTLPVDLRVIDREAKYGVKEVKLGIFPSSGATQWLPRMVGLSKAKEIVLTGDFVDPAEAHDIGLVHEIVDDREDVDDRARAMADDLSKNAPLGLERARTLLNSALDVPIDEGLAHESALGSQLVDTHDYEEGFTAQLEGREPEFKGE